MKKKSKGTRLAKLRRMVKGSPELMYANELTEYLIDIRGYTVKELAEKIGMGYHSVYRWYTGSRRKNTNVSIPVKNFLIDLALNSHSH